MSEPALEQETGECARCMGDIHRTTQPAGSGYGWTHTGGTRFCPSSSNLAHPTYRRQ